MSKSIDLNIQQILNHVKVMTEIEPYIVKIKYNTKKHQVTSVNYEIMDNKNKVWIKDQEIMQMLTLYKGQYIDNYLKLLKIIQKLYWILYRENNDYYNSAIIFIEVGRGYEIAKL